MSYLVKPFSIIGKKFSDERGSFSPLILHKDFSKFNVFQLNTVITDKPYTFRGLHWQDAPYEQAKLIRCIQGGIIDFVIDIRPNSELFGKTYMFHLFNKDTWVYVPTGFAHGYITLSNSNNIPTIVEYLVDNEYNKDSERGIYMTEEIIKTIEEEVGNLKDIHINERDKSWIKIDELKEYYNIVKDECKIK